MTSRQLIKSARLVTVIAGSVGLEALMLKKPVVTLGRVPFNFLPKGMIRHVQDLDQLGWEIHDLLESHNHNEKNIIAYVSAVIENSVQVDFYSVLLGRKGVYQPGSNTQNKGKEYQAQIGKFSDYIMGITKINM